MAKRSGPLFRFFAAAVLLAGLGVRSATHIEAQGGVVITFPTPGTKVAAAPDFATDSLGDPWDFSNPQDLALDPEQVRGFTSQSLANGQFTVTASSTGANFSLLQRAYYNILNPGRNGRNFPITSTAYTKLAFKMTANNN